MARRPRRRRAKARRRKPSRPQPKVRRPKARSKKLQSRRSSPRRPRLRSRKRRRRRSPHRPGADKVTMTDFLVRACALALRKFPEVNSSWVDGRFQRKRSVNIGLAVAPSQGMGLLVPVVHDADTKDIVQISIESRQVIERARSGRPAEGALSGATFSISNLGTFGVDAFVAIINPPEAAILAVGAIKA